MSNIWARFIWHFFRYLCDASVTRAAGSYCRSETAFSVKIVVNWLIFVDVDVNRGRSDPKRPLVDTVARQKELGIEHHLHFAQLVFPVLAAQILQKRIKGVCTKKLGKGG